MPTEDLQGFKYGNECHNSLSNKSSDNNSYLTWFSFLCKFLEVKYCLYQDSF